MYLILNEFQPPSQYTCELQDVVYPYEECRTEFPSTGEQFDQDYSDNQSQVDEEVCQESQDQTVTSIEESEN